MGTCTICGEPAGFLRSSHRTCVEARENALNKIPQIFTGYLALDSSKSDPARLGNLIRNFALQGHILGNDYQRVIQNGLEAAILEAVADRVLTDEEILRLDEITSVLGLKISDIGDLSQQFLLQALTLRDLRAGAVRPRIGDVSALPIALKKDEKPLWLFSSVHRLEPKVRTSYVGGSHGFSFRIMTGVSYHVGSHRGERIETTSLADRGTGLLAVTNKAIYFLAPGNTFRLSLKSVATVECYSDAISIAPGRGKSQIFIMTSQQFATDLIKAAGALS